MVLGGFFLLLLSLSWDWVKAKPFIRQMFQERGSELHQSPHCWLTPDALNSGGRFQKNLNGFFFPLLSPLPALCLRSPGRGPTACPSPARWRWSTPTPCWRSPASSRTTQEDTSAWPRTGWARTRPRGDWPSTVLKHSHYLTKFRSLIVTQLDNTTAWFRSSASSFLTRYIVVGYKYLRQKSENCAETTAQRNKVELTDGILTQCCRI